MYQEELMDHAKYPRNKKAIVNPDFSTEELNPSCGDKIHMEGTITHNNIINNIGFDGSGCVISQATASMLTEQCTGKSIDDILALNKDFVLELIKIPLGPNRLKCALLPLNVLQSGLRSYKNKKLV